MEEERKFSVYMHVCPNGKRYIGATGRNPKTRWGTNGHKYKANKRFWTDIELFGWDNIQHIILKENLTLEESQYWEKYYIKKYNTTNPEYGYNLTEGGEYSPSGWHHKEETIEKCRQVNLGKKESEETKMKKSKSLKGKNKGKHRSEEFKEKCRERQLGKKQSEETKMKMSESMKGKNKGKKQSEEAKEKNRQAHLGKYCYNNGEINIFAFDCPSGFVPGRLKKANK